MLCRLVNSNPFFQGYRENGLFPKSEILQGEGTILWLVERTTKQHTGLNSGSFSTLHPLRTQLPRQWGQRQLVRCGAPGSVLVNECSRGTPVFDSNRSGALGCDYTASKYLELGLQLGDLPPPESTSQGAQAPGAGTLGQPSDLPARLPRPAPRCLVLSFHPPSSASPPPPLDAPAFALHLH